MDAIQQGGAFLEGRHGGGVAVGGVVGENGGLAVHGLGDIGGDGGEVGEGLFGIGAVLGAVLEKLLERADVMVLPVDFGLESLKGDLGRQGYGAFRGPLVELGLLLGGLFLRGGNRLRHLLHLAGDDDHVVRERKHIVERLLEGLGGPLERRGKRDDAPVHVGVQLAHLSRHRQEGDGEDQKDDAENNLGIAPEESVFCGGHGEVPVFVD